jgi:hypothetical protein
VTEAIEAAQATHTELRSKLDAERDELQRTDVRRNELAFEAHAHGGEAKKELDKLNRSRATQLAEIETLEAALLEASRRIAAAEQAANDAEMSGRAERAIEISARLVEHAEKIDEALAIVVERSKAFEDDLRELNHRLGCSNPNEHQFASLGVRAFKAAMMMSPLQIEHMAPRERHSFTDLATDWSTTISNWAARWLVREAA